MKSFFNTVKCYDNNGNGNGNVIICYTKGFIYFINDYQIADGDEIQKKDSMMLIDCQKLERYYLVPDREYIAIRQPIKTLYGTTSSYN